MFINKHPLNLKVSYLLFIAFYQIGYSQLSPQKWQEDLSTFVENLEEFHPDPYHHITKEVFYDSLELTKKRISNNDIANQIHVIKLVSLLRDRHTSIYPNSVFKNWLPLSIYKFEDGFYIVSGISKHKNLLGAKILSFEDTPSELVFNKVADLHSSDNDIGRQLNTYYMSSLDVLEHYKFSNSKKQISLQVELANGEQQKVVISGVNFARKLQNVTGLAEFFGPMDESTSSNYVMAYKELNVREYYNQPLEEKVDIPLFLRNRRGYWYDYLKDHKTMYIAVCYSTHNSRNGFDNFNAFLDEVFFEIDNNPIDKVILDIRFNPGGDGSITLPLVHEFIKREQINTSGKLFTLIGRKTYSAAQMIYAEMLKHTNTLLVGEPAGAPVNGYGDPTSFTLPNSKMHYQISTAYWQMGHPNDNSWVQKVDIPIVINGKDYMEGIDRTMDYILSLEGNFKSLPELLKSSDITTFQNEYHKRFQDFGKYNWWKPFEEREMRYIARDLYDQGEIKKGELGFKALIEMYPNSWRAHRDYARRLINLKEFDAALKVVNKGLKVHSSNNDLQDLLELINKNIKN